LHVHLISLKIVLEAAFRYFRLVSRVFERVRKLIPLRIRIGVSDVYLLKDQLLQQNIMLQASKAVGK